MGTAEGKLSVSLDTEGRLKYEIARLKEENQGLSQRLQQGLQQGQNTQQSELQLILREKAKLEDKLQILIIEN